MGRDRVVSLEPSNRTGPVRRALAKGFYQGTQDSWRMCTSPRALRIYLTFNPLP